jgi:hypothetical protein
MAQKVSDDLRVRKAIAYMRDNPSAALGTALRAAGFSPAYAKNPQLIKGTKKWQDLMREFFPDLYVLGKQQSQLEANRVEKANFYHKMKDSAIREIIEGQGFTYLGVKRFMTTAIVYFSMPDWLTRDKALDKLYKLRGDYAPERITIEDDLKNLTDEELAQRIKERQNFLSKKK